MKSGAESSLPHAKPAREPSPQTHWTLIERLKDWGDDSSWREFFETYSGLIYGVALKAGLTETEAQEALQETIISVAKKMPGFKCGSASGSFKGFLMQITSRRIADQFRKRPRESYVSTGLRDDLRTATIERVPDPAGFDLEREWNAEWHRHSREAVLEIVKRKADPEQYQMFELHVFQDLPVHAVARKFGVNPARVYFAKYKIARLLKTTVNRLQKESQ